MAEINQIFESKQEYNDFTLIIQKLREATEPSPKTAISDFTMDELQKLKSII